MADTLRHRGPDDDGYWIDAQAGIALSHRRLSIIDRSPLGRQPMLSRAGRYVIVFNGEIYNHRRLRVELGEGQEFTGRSDTEVMLAAIETWGLKAALDKFIGMFAFALWDRKHRQLHLIRDRLGIKPLYYGWIDDAFVFGSELRAIAAYPRFTHEVNRDALTLLLRHSCIPAPHSIYRGISKLLPGTILTLPYPDARDRPVVPFWSAKAIAQRGGECPRDEHQAVEELDSLLRDAVALRMVADVPLGAFLSGGVDSSLVVAMMQAESTRRVKTFCIGVADNNYDEAKYARAVAQHLRTDHTELYVTAQEALAVVPELPAIYDEPFADSSQIPTFIVSRLARQDVTVALSGDGGDELFAGYVHHFAGAEDLEQTSGGSTEDPFGSRGPHRRRSGQQLGSRPRVPHAGDSSQLRDAGLQASQVCRHSLGPNCRRGGFQTVFALEGTFCSRPRSNGAADGTERSGAPGRSAGRDRADTISPI